MGGEEFEVIEIPQTMTLIAVRENDQRVARGVPGENGFFIRLLHAGKHVVSRVRIRKFVVGAPVPIRRGIEHIKDERQAAAGMAAENGRVGRDGNLGEESRTGMNEEIGEVDRLVGDRFALEVVDHGIHRMI